MSFRNRCIVAGANGPVALTVPVMGGREQRSQYVEVRIDYREDWQIRHWRTLFSAYGRAPFFEHYGPGLESLFGQRVDKISDWNLLALDWVAKSLGLSLPEQVDILSGEPDRNLSDRIRPKGYADPGVGIPSPVYAQVFQDRFGFLPNLSILDLLFCCGPGARSLLRA
jgi:hypothetical protein